MKISHSTIPELTVEAVNRSKEQLLRDVESLWLAGAEGATGDFNADDWTIEYLVNEVSDICKKELTDSDWRVSRAAERGESLDSSWVTYREALRTMINNEASGVITWPTKPE